MNNTMPLSKSSLVGAAFFSLTLAGWSPAAIAAASFSDVTATAIDSTSSETWGVSIGDMNGDFWPDVFVGNHRNRPSIYRNNGDGTLSNSILQVDTSRSWLSNRFADHHGASWSDFDGDGDDDLFAGTNGCCFSEFMVSDNGVFTDQASSRIGQKTNSGYVAWFDIDRNGLSDLIQARGSHSYFLQDSSGNFGASTSVPNCGGDWLMLSDLTGDHQVEYICFNEGTFPRRIYDVSTGNFNDITANYPTVSNVVDSTAVDLNNDLQSDLVFVRGATLANQAYMVNDTRIEAALDSSPNQGSAGFTFTGGGDVSFTVHTRHSNLVFNAGNQTQTISKKGTVSLSPADTSLHGSANATGLSVAVGYEPATDTWTFTQSDSAGWFYIYVEVDASAPLSNVQTTGLRAVDGPTRPNILMKESNAFVNRTFEAGLAIDNVECNSVAAADFDNDMDQDLYFVCSRGAENIANRLFENQGDGTFVESSGAGGASGVTGSSVHDRAGNGENVGVADFNNDGYLDLFVTNGINSQPLRSAGGPHQLFMNNADSGNNWIELELQGTTSNSDGIGASVVAIAGGVSQLREQSGVYHRWSQSHNRIHFGLAGNSTVDLIVRWPNGVEESFSGVSANSLYVVSEGNGLTVINPEPPVPFDAPQVGDECGTPLHHPSLDKALLVYRDCTTGIWSVRASAGGSATGLSFSGRVSTDSSFSAVNGFNLESSDILDSSSTGEIAFRLDVAGAGEDGFVFQDINATQICLELDTPSDVRILLGPKHLPVQAPFDVIGMGNCEGPGAGLSIADIVVEESVGTATVTVSLDPPASTAVGVNVSTVPGTASPGTDFYGLFMHLDFAAGESSKAVEITILDDIENEDDENLLVRLTAANGAAIADGEASVTINDNDQSGLNCGAPIFIPSQDEGLYIWKACDGTWHMVSSGGGNSSGRRYTGSLSSSTGFATITSSSQEPNDTVDTTSPHAIDFLQRVANAGTDSIQFVPNSGAELCLTAAQSAPGGVPVRIGAAQTVVSAPVNPITLLSCTPQTNNIPPSIQSIPDQTSQRGTPLSLAVNASDANGDVLSFVADGLPDGLSINAATGVISGTPSSAGSYAVSVSVTDAPGATASSNFDWNIDGVATSFSTRINNNNDDAEERRPAGSMYLTSTDLELVTDGSQNQLVGMRFTSVGIPQGATITNAYIEFTVDENNSGTTSVIFKGQASANPATFSSATNDISNRPLTSASSNWSNISPWTVDAVIRSPSLRLIVEEIINRPDWNSGNAMVFVVSGTGERTAESHNGESDSAPRLVIEYLQ